MAFLQLPIDARTAPFEKAGRRGSTLSEASTADSSRRGSVAASEASASGTVMIPTVSGEMLEVSLIALERAEQDLLELLLANGSMTIRTLGQKYSAAHGVNFTKAVGLTLACYLHSAHGVAFVVESGFAPDKKGKVLPFKDLVSIRPEPAPTPRTELRLSKRTLESALATVTQAMETLGVEACTPAVKNTFLEFKPQDTTSPKRKTCGGRFARTLSEAEAWPLCEDSDDKDSALEVPSPLACAASPHAFPVEYDLPEYSSPSRFGASPSAGSASPVAASPVFAEVERRFAPVAASPVAASPVAASPMAASPMAASPVAIQLTPVPMVMDPQQLLAMNMQMAQNLFAAQQQIAMLHAQVQQQAQQIADLKRR